MNANGNALNKKERNQRTIEKQQQKTKIMPETKLIEYLGEFVLTK